MQITDNPLKIRSLARMLFPKTNKVPASGGVRRVDFHSSVELATFQTGLLRALAAAGWTARHRFQVSQADYWNARSPMERWNARVQAYAVYPARLAAEYLRKRDGIGVVCTNTFFAPGLAELAGRRVGVPVVHWVFDLFPDALVLAGRVRGGSLAERLLRTWVRATLNAAAANVFLGKRLQEFAEENFGPIPRSHVIPVGCDATPFRDSLPLPRAPGSPVRVLYCGNLGRMHDIDTFLALATAGLPTGIAFEFRGNGASYRALESAVRASTSRTQIGLGGHIPVESWIAAMAGADVALVTMRPGAESVVMPSKTYSAMAAGQAILAICPRRSDLADTVLAHDCGWVVNPGDHAKLRSVLEGIVADPAPLLQKKGNAWKAGQEVYDQQILVKQWIDVLNSAREFR